MIGPDAKVAVISGGGSAALRPSWTVTAFDAITEVAKEVLGLEAKDIKYARGGNAHKWAPLFVSPVRCIFACQCPAYVSCFLGAIGP